MEACLRLFKLLFHFLLIFFLCFLLLPTWSNSSGEEGMSEWWYWYMHISSSCRFLARDISLSWQLCRCIRNANRVTKFSVYERTEHLWNMPALPHLLSDLCEAWNCPSNKRIRRTEMCEEIQAVPSHSNLSESARKSRRRKKKKTIESHNCFWCSVLVKVSVGLTQDLMVPSAPSPPHRETAWHIQKRKKSSRVY